MPTESISRWQRNGLLPQSALRLLPLLAAIAITGGCAVHPKPTTPDEIQARATTDQVKIYANQEPIEHPIRFEEAVARALKYNLDYRLKLMESALASGQAELVSYDMLPSLLASAGYVFRNNYYVTNSVNIETGETQLSNSTSQEKNRAIGSAALTWDLLDFGVGYYRARQKGNELLMAEERRQRVIQNILQDVRISYWRALAAQNLEQQTHTLHEKARQALEMYRKAEREGIVPHKETLDFQRLMLDTVMLLSQREQDLEIAKRELAALMSIPPDTPFTLADTLARELPPMPINARELEDLALRTRPELREEDYRVRVTANEVRARMLSFFPNLSLSLTPQYDSNQYNLNQSWIDSGVKLGLNLLKLPSLPAAQRVNEAQVKVDDARRMALSMAILTQVRVALERYRLALQDYQLARQSQSLDDRLADYANASLQSETGGELELIRAKTRALNSEYARYTAFATAQSAYGRIYNSVGLAVLPTDLKPELSVAELADVVSAHVTQVEQATLSAALTDGQTR